MWNSSMATLRLPTPVKMCVDRVSPVSKASQFAEKAAAGTNLIWANGTTLRIAFSGGTRAARWVVMQAAAIWSRFANINFVQVDSGQAEIRCSFDIGGSWSYLGREILTIAPWLPTMNIGWGPDLPTCLHELGHSLGLIHEHQNPLAGIPWDRAKVLAFYEGPPNYWPAEQTIENVLNRYAGPLTNGGYDRKSIMEYPNDAQLLTNPAFAVGWNTDLSPGDRDFIAKLYPGRIQSTPIVTVVPVTIAPAPVLTKPTSPAKEQPVVSTAVPGILTSIQNEIGTLFKAIDDKVNFTAIEKTVVDAYMAGGVDSVLPALVKNAPSFAEDPADARLVEVVLKLVSGVMAFKTQPPAS